MSQMEIRPIRELLRIPIKLEVIENSSTSSKVFLGYTLNVSQSGLGLNVAGDSAIDKDSQIVINLDVEKYRSLKVPAKLVWQSNSHCGLRFLEEVRDIADLLQKAAAPALELQNLKLKKFYPYVGDEDIDTRKYEFFPYADKLITDFRKVREYGAQLKRGLSPAGAESYFYAQYAVADSELNKAAILSAHKAFKEFRSFSMERRRRILDDAREILLQEKGNIIELMIIEGHPRKVAEWEYSGMVSTITKESLDHFQSEMLQTAVYDNETVLQIRRPNGVVCVSTPRNASSIGFMAGLALLAGNTLVIKPPLQMPICSIYMWRNVFGKALKINGAPRGSINILIGNSTQFMQEWLDNPMVHSVFFFGDSEKGLEIGKKIFEKGKKPILELSGNDYMVLWKDASVEESADSLLDCFMGSTQICMVAKKAIIHAEIYSKFIEVFIDKVKRLKVGLPSDPETILSPVNKISTFFEHLNDAVQNGANLLTGGYRMNHSGERDENGFYIAPTVIEVPIELANSMKCIREENFFPLLPIIKVNGGGLTTREKDITIFKRMLEIMESNQYGLRISAWVKDQWYLRRFIEDIHFSGLLRINSRHVGFSHGLSVNGGIGKSGGPFGEMNHVWQKTSHLQGISITRLQSRNSLSETEKTIEKEIHNP